MGLKDDLHALSGLRLQVERQLTAGKNFGRQLKDLRLERGMTLDRLATRTGISKAYLSQVENERVDPPRDEKIRRLEKAFELQPGELVTLAHLARTPQDVRDRLVQLRAAFTRAEQTVQTLLVRLPEGAVNKQRTEAGQGGFPWPDDGGNVSGPRPVRRQVPIINRVAAGYPAEFTD
ncbi:MAG: helix-turn-helix domain-containing protein, partial [Anaerolineaceae bacterium]|nr:helix-turn-helix domain-containing protein [Anaerolineaceae bacterium]